MITTYVHPRLGLPKFLTFEPFFLSALEEFDRGQETKFTMMGGLSPSTVAARMRDSLQGYRLNSKHWGTSVNPQFVALFAKHDGQFVIAGPDTNGEVWFRCRHKKGGHVGTTFCEVEGHLDKHIRRTVSPSPTGVPAAQVIRARSCDRDVVLSYGHLKGRGELSMPVIFPGPVEPSIVAELINTSDVAFNFDSERNETILM